MDFSYKLIDGVSPAMNAISKASEATAKQAEKLEAQLDKLNRQSAIAAAQKEKDPAKKQAQYLKLELDRLKGISKQHKLDLDATKKRGLVEKAGDNQKKQNMDDLMGGLKGLAGFAVTAAAAVAAVGIAFVAASVKASQFRKGQERGLSFSVGKANAGAEYDILRKIADASGRENADIIDAFKKASNIGFTSREAENILTVAADASSASADAFDAVKDAYTGIKKSQNDLVNMGKGAFDKGVFDRLVESGAIDRKTFLEDLGKAYKITDKQALRLLQSGGVRGDVAESVLTSHVRSRFDRGKNGAVGTEALDESKGNVGKGLDKVKNQFMDLISKVDTSPLEKGLGLVADLIGKIDASAVSGALSAFFTFAAARAAVLWEQGKRLYNVFSTFVGPAFADLGKTLSPVIDLIGRFFGSSTDMKILGTLLVGVGYAIGGIVWVINNAIKSIQQTFKVLGDWTGLMTTLGGDIVAGLVKGLLGGVNLVKNAMGSVGDAAVKGLKDVLGIHSPSRVMFALGGHTAKGFALGTSNGPSAQLPPIMAPAAPDMRASGSIFAPPSPAISPAALGGGGRGGGGGFSGNITVNVPVTMSGGGDDKNPAAVGAELANQIGDAVRNELVKVLESIGYQTGDIGVT